MVVVVVVRFEGTMLRVFRVVCLLVYVYSSLLGHLPLAQIPAGPDRHRSHHCLGGTVTVLVVVPASVSKVIPTASLFEM